MIRKLIAAASILAISAVQANAATASGNLAISIAINATCAVGAGTLDFGTQSNIGGAANIDAAGSFTVTCTNATAYSTTLGSGANFSGSRRMTNGTDFISYGIYSDVARTTAWPALGVSGTGSGAAQTISVYGRIPTGQTSVSTGTYGDSVQITVTY